MDPLTLRKQPKDKLLAQLHSDVDSGLTEDSAKTRLQLDGANLLPEKKTHPYRDFFLSQAKDPIILILLLAALIKYFTDSIQDALAILAVIVFNTTLGLLHQRKAIKAMQSLKELINPQARVIRDGIKKDISSSELVVGDLIVLESGMKVPADARLIETLDLMSDESMLTGESCPVLKNADESCFNSSQPQDFINCVFSGTIITKGRAKAIVIATGAQTEIGKIAASLSSIDDTPSPLQLRLNAFSRKLSLAIVALVAIMALIGFFKGYGLNQLFLIAVSLIVSAIPEGLPLAITMCLIIGIQKMAEKKALIKKLSCVETLGSTTVICSDKTGTLTCNQMTATHLCIVDQVLKITGAGYDHQGHIEGNYPLLEIALNASSNHETSIFKKNGHYEVHGDPTEAALIVLSKKIPAKINPSFTKVVIPFESENRYMATLITNDGKHYLMLKGAVDKVLSFCDKMSTIHGEHLPIDKQLIETKAAGLSSQALRVLALAYIPLSTCRTPSKIQGAIFSGLVGMQDPLRPNIHETIKKCTDAGILVKMITGDHPHTAQAIYNQLKGHSHYTLLKGADIDQMDPHEKISKLPETDIFARVSPHNKLEIVQSLQNKGHIVAMTGDGVNDSPSLKGADIGIAMGSGSDVAKETASVILLDDNFITLVKAVEMGRMIFLTLQNLIVYLLMTALSGVLTICLSIFMGWPIPLAPIQLLWINLVTDGSTTVPMVFEKLRASLMQRPPMEKDAPIVESSRLIHMITLSSIMSLGTLLIFYYSLFIRKDTSTYAQTMAFTTLALFQIFNAQNARSKDEPCFLEFRHKEHMIPRLPFSNNLPLVCTMLVAFILQIAAVEFKFLQPYIQTTGLSINDWALIGFGSFMIMIASDFMKWTRFRLNLKH